MEGAWNDDDEAVEEQGPELLAIRSDTKIEKPGDIGRNGGGGLPSPPASERSETYPETTEGADAAHATKPKDTKLRGTTTMLDEEDVGAMPQEDIKESWIKIALGLREDLSVQCVLYSNKIILNSPVLTQLVFCG